MANWCILVDVYLKSVGVSLFCTLLLLCWCPSASSLSAQDVAELHQHYDVRLRGSSKTYEGRVEIYIQIDESQPGTWRTLCDAPYGLRQANVICRQLNYGSATNATTGSHFGASTLTPLSGQFVCGGDETKLGDCKFMTDRGNCNSNREEAGVVCSPPAPRCPSLQLPSDKWVSEFQQTYDEYHRVDVVCKADTTIRSTLQCAGGKWRGKEPECPEYREAHYCSAPAVGKNIFLRPFDITYQYDATVELVCSDRSNTTTLRCGENGRWKCMDSTSTCTPHAPVCVTQNKTDDDTVLLVGGTKPTEGRVLVKSSMADRWRPICADDWDLADAEVVCRQLGHGPAKEAVTSAERFTPGDKAYLFTKTACAGTEETIQECQHVMLHRECKSDQEAGVDCYPEDLPCQLPGLPKYAVAKSGYQFSYKRGDDIQVTCPGSSDHETWRCTGRGVWSGKPVECYSPEPVSFAQECGLPPTPPNSALSASKMVYDIGESVAVSCLNLGLPGNPSETESATWKCRSDGRWSGDMIDCGKAIDPNTGAMLLVGVGLLMIIIECAVPIIFCCCCRRSLQPKTAERGKPPQVDDAHTKPANQGLVKVDPRPRQTQPVKGQ